MIRIETERLVFLDHLVTDLEEFHALFSDPAIMHIVSFGPYRTLEESAQSLNDAVAEAADPDRRRYFLAVLERRTGAYAGDCGLTIQRQRGDGGVAELGYFLLREYWGRGLATEVCRGLMDFAFRNLPLHKLCASCDAGNVASERVMQKCGMTKEAHNRLHRLRGEEWVDNLVYAILRSEWRNGETA
jgi:[ribosomal protein S5]-alanine N-acetyltransferase